MGAVASPGVRVLNSEAVRALKISDSVIDSAAAAEMREVERQQRVYRGTALFPTLTGRTVIVVDDGLATGSTMRAAVQALRQSHPDRIVVAVPVAARDTAQKLRREADEVVCVETPDDFHAVSLWYERFSQTSDDEVRTLLRAAQAASLN